MYNRLGRQSQRPSLRSLRVGLICNSLVGQDFNVLVRGLLHPLVGYFAHSGVIRVYNRPHALALLRFSLRWDRSLVA